MFSYQSISGIACIAAAFVMFAITLWILKVRYYHGKLMKKVKNIISHRFEWSPEKPITIKTEFVNRILCMSVVELLNALKAGEFTSVDIVSVYIQRSITHARTLNATTEEFFDEALKAAKLSDEKRASGKPIGLLEGIPISVKDCFDQVNADSSCGLVAKIGFPATSDCLLIMLLREQGML